MDRKNMNRQNKKRRKKGMNKKVKGWLQILWGIIAIELVMIGIVYLAGKVSEKLAIYNVPSTPGSNNGDVLAPEKLVGMTAIIGWETADDGTTVVSFSPAENAVGYELAYRIGEEDWICEIATEPKVTFAASIGSIYEVKARAFNQAGTYGSYSDPIVLEPGSIVPIPLLVTASSCTLDFAWNSAGEGVRYTVNYRPKNSDQWERAETTQSEIILGGLVPGTEYTVQVIPYSNGEAICEAGVGDFSTKELGGYADPFRSVYATLTVFDQTKGVLISNVNGCKGAKAWVQVDAKMYESADRSGQVTAVVPGGVALTVTPDEKGNYAYQVSKYDWSLHIEGMLGNFQYKGWVQANALLIDLADVFPKGNQYSIQYNRTNARSSIFTVGGNGRKVELTGSESSRYDLLMAEEGSDALLFGGYNRIPGVTGEKLPNYGPEDQMPAVWDLALELITCQRNALKSGNGLLIYESYRPRSTSNAVYRAMTSGGFLKTSNGGHNLANGFLKVNLSEANYIANNSKHNKGIAVDLTLMEYTDVNTLGAELVMQTKMHTLDFRCNMAYNNENANLLLDIMTAGTGLVPLKAKQEWWHFEMNTDTTRFPLINNYVFADYQI